MHSSSLIKVPKKSLKFILFQRTGYLQNNYLMKLLNYFERFQALSDINLRLKSNLFASKIIKEYSEDIEREFSTIKSHLPANASSILDIGCGVAGIDIFLARHYNNNIKIFLLDKTHIERRVYYGFEKKGAFYNSLEIAKKMLENNGITSGNIFFQEATDKNEINFEEKFDIIISLISWGFHYPVSVYLDEVYEKLNSGGVLILDVRKNTGGEEEIAKKFGGFKVVLDTDKMKRIVATK